MATDGPHHEIVLGVVIVVLLGAVTAWMLRTSHRHALLELAAVWLGLFLAWKYGFVRQDGHVLTFFAYAAVAPFVLWGTPWLQEHTAWKLNAALSLCIVLAMGGALRHRHDAKWPGPVSATVRRVVHNVSVLARLQRTQGELHAQRRQQQRRLPMPRVVQRVGTSSIDEFTVSQGIVLLHDLTWQPRPVFQSYSAYTPALSRVNARFFARPSAPRFALVNWQTIDDRFPTLDDGQVLLELARNYTPVLSESGYELLEHHPQSAAPTRQAPLLREKARFGKTLDIAILGDTPKVLVARIGYSVWGRLAKLFYKPLPIRLFVGFSNGTTKRYRVVPGMLRGGVLLDPLPGDATQINAFLRNGSGPRVASIRFGTRGRTLYESTIELQIWSADLPSPAAQKPSDVARRSTDRAGP